MAKPTTWMITCEGAPALAAVADGVAKAGGEVTSRLEAVGILVARGSKAQAAAWRRLPGVAAVEADIGVDIGPPDSPLS